MIPFKNNTLSKSYHYIIIILFSSCQYLEKQVPSEMELLQKELKTINWNEVDEYPSMVDCDSIANKKQQQQCFFERLTQIIQEKMSVNPLSTRYSKFDTIAIKVTVFPDATIQFEPQFPKDSITPHTARIDSVFRSRLVNFPEINPAIKRGIPVKTQFILPVIIKTK